MSRIEEIKKDQKIELKKLSKKYNLSYSSLERLVDAEKVKKLLKRKASMQQTISKEIERNINEN